MEKKFKTFIARKTYSFDVHDKDGNLTSNLTESEWKQSIIDLLKNDKQKSQENLLIFHDHDYHNTGDMTGLHVHMVLYNKNSRYLSAVKKSLNITDEEDPLDKKVSVAKNKTGAYRYLTHISETAIKDKKYLYPVSDLILIINGEIQDEQSTRDYYMKKIQGKQKDESSLKLKELYDESTVEIAKGKPLREIRKRFETEFGNQGIGYYYKQLSYFDKARNDYLDDKRESLLDGSRDLNLTYVNGESGIGKTKWVREYTKLITDRKGYDKPSKSVYTAPSANKSYDLLSNYSFQEITIIDDVPVINYRDLFLSSFDSQNTIVSSRYHDKYFYSEDVFILKSMNMRDYFKPVIENIDDYQSNKLNAIKQVLRRINYQIELTENEIKVSKNDDSGINFKLLKSFKISKSERMNDSDKMLKINNQIYDLTQNS